VTSSFNVLRSAWPKDEPISNPISDPKLRRATIRVSGHQARGNQADRRVGCCRRSTPKTLFRSRHACHTPGVNVAGAAALLMQGLPLEELPNLADLEAVGGIDAAYDVTHEELLLDVAILFDVEELWSGRPGLPLLNQLDLEVFGELADTSLAPPRRQWITAVPYGSEQFLLYPDDGSTGVKFTVFAPVQSTERLVMLARATLTVTDEQMKRAEEPALKCRWLVEGVGRGRRSICDPVDCPNGACTLRGFGKGRAKMFSCRCK
jgi:hypothetical protein